MQDTEKYLHEGPVYVDNYEFTYLHLSNALKTGFFN